MKNELIDTPRGRMTKLQFTILEAIARQPDANDRVIAEALDTSPMHVGRVRNRFLGKRKRKGANP